MPALNVIKEYIKDGCYHIFNRGVERRKIFPKRDDYAFFLYLLKKHLTCPVSASKAQGLSLEGIIPVPTIWKEIRLLAYCLMPSHFHLLVKQLTKEAMTKLMRRVATTYSMYFNKKYKRKGHLFQGPYKAVSIYTEDNLLNVANYIHLNPLEVFPEKLSQKETLKRLIEYPYSSLGNYLGKRRNSWVKTEEILKIVGGKRNYRKLLYKPFDLPISFEDYLARLRDNPSKG